MNLCVIEGSEPHVGSGHDRNRTTMIALEAPADLKHPATGSPSGCTTHFAKVFGRRASDDKPWNYDPYGNLAVALRRIWLRLGLRHPPSGAITFAVIGIKIDAPQRLRRRDPALRQSARLNGPTVPAEGLRFEIGFINFC